MAYSNQTVFPGTYVQPCTIASNSSKAVVNNGGTVLGVANAQLQNTRVITNGMGATPYLGIVHNYTENKPVINAGATNNLGTYKSVSAGTFGVMVAGKYIMVGFTSQIAGIANTLFNSPGLTANVKSQATMAATLYTAQYETNNGWYTGNTGWLYQTGQPINKVSSADTLNTETYPGTYAIPGRITYLQGALTALTASYKAKTD